MARGFSLSSGAKGLLAVGDDNHPRPARHGQGPVFHVKHPEAREAENYAKNAWFQGPRLFAKGPRRRQIKERGPRGAVLKCLIWRDFARFVVPKAREP